MGAGLRVRIGRQSGWVVALTLLGAGSTARADEPLTFATVLRQGFARVDVNGSGELEPAEIVAGLHNPAIGGDEAAVLAALHSYVEQETAEHRGFRVTRRWAEGSPVVGLRRAVFYALPGNPSASPPPAPPALADATETLGAVPAMLNTQGAKAYLTPQGFFDRARRAIGRADRRLFGDDDAPVLSDLRQGSLGDCYLISVLGAQVKADPRAIARMLRQNPDGSYDVDWRDGLRTHVDPLTDGELGLGGAGVAGGLWVRVMEKALARRDRADTTGDLLTQDAIGKGGQIRPMIARLTGRQVGVAVLPAMFKKSEDPVARSETAKRLREIVAAAIADKRLVAAGTGPASLVRLPPGIDPQHAWAVIDYDRNRDLLTLWNPHAGEFTPGGPPGYANGYLTRRGMSWMPMDDFVRVFIQVAWETDKPLTQR